MNFIYLKSLNNSTLRQAIRRVSRQTKGSRPLLGVVRLVRLLSFAGALKSSAFKNLAVMRISFHDFPLRSDNKG